jgi:alpha-ketoglutarate-dependent taurine dioxygenase
MASAAPRRLRTLINALEPQPAAKDVAAAQELPAPAAADELETRPVDSSLDFGVEVTSPFDLAEMAEHGTRAAEIYDMIVQHGVVVFRGQRMSEEQEIKLSCQLPVSTKFRPPALEYLGNTDSNGERLESFVRKEGDGRYWHVDGSQNALPMVMTLISAAAPNAQCGGSRTLFASGVRAVEELSPEDRALAENLAVRYSRRDPETQEYRPQKSPSPGSDRNAKAFALSPLLRNHDETRERLMALGTGCVGCVHVHAIH